MRPTPHPSSSGKTTLRRLLTAGSLLALSAAAAGTVLAQPPMGDPAAHRAAIEKIDFLVGEWEGEGWISMGPDQRRTLRSWERVESRLGGSALLVEGRHFRQAGDEEQLVHHALALVSWDEDHDRYRFSTALFNRTGGEFPAFVRDDGAFVWQIEAPGRSIRYVIRLDEEGRWSEKGEMSTDEGETWRPFFGMTLSRLGP